MSKPVTIYRVSLFSGVVSMALSYAINQSILWCIVHFFFGWFYVLYWLFTYTEFQEWILQWVVK